MLRKLRAAIQPPAPAGSGSPAGQPTAAMLSGGLQVGVVGESHYQDALTAIVGGTRPEASTSRPKPPSCPSRTTPLTPTPSPSTSLGGRSGTFQERPPKPSHQSARRLAEQQQVGACSATITGAGIVGTATGHFGVTLDLAHPNQL
jgi:hypothetical protein